MQQHLVACHPHLNHPHSSPLPFTTAAHMGVHVTNNQDVHARRDRTPHGSGHSASFWPQLGPATLKRHNVHSVLRKRTGCAIPIQRHKRLNRLARTSSQRLTPTSGATCFHMLLRQVHSLSQAKDVRNPYLHTRRHGPHSKDPPALAPQQQPHASTVAANALAAWSKISAHCSIHLCTPVVPSPRQEARPPGLCRPDNLASQAVSLSCATRAA